MNKPKIFTQQTKDQIKAMYASGIKAKEIAARTGLNHSGVKSVLAKMNKKDAALKQVHNEHYGPQRAIEWWDRQPTKWRQDAMKFLDDITVQEIWEYCTRNTTSSVYSEEAHDN